MSPALLVVPLELRKLQFERTRVTLDSFKQSSSIINRLKMIMVTIAFFAIFASFALYLSSISNLKGLQDLNTANILLDLNSNMIENLNSAENELEKIKSKKDLNEIQFAFDENRKVIASLINESMRHAKSHVELTQLLLTTKEMINQFNSYHAIITNLLMENPVKDKLVSNELEADIIVAKQFAMDAKESLRKVQILVKKENDERFKIIYQNRFTPLAVTIALSALLFIFVITFGLSISKKIGRSVLNLLNATDLVAQGNLDYQVKIIERDEIGRLTGAFNKMIFSLKTGQNQLSQAVDKTMRLQNITAAFSEALTPDQVYEVIFKQGFESLGAIAAGVVLVSEDKNFIELKRLEGYGEETFLRWKRFPINADVPSAQVIRFRQPIFMGRAELSNFTDLKKNDVAKGNSFASLPLIMGSEAFGAISFSFASEKQFSQEEKDFMIAISRQCAQAIHRSQLYDSAKKAIEARDEFLSIASHELRTPLTPLKLQIQGVARQVRSGNFTDITPERLQRMVETSDKQINRLSTLIDDLLDVSRITSGKLILKKEFFSLKEMIIEVVKQYSHYLQDSHSSAELKIEKDSMGHWDKVRIEQVFINLLTNAAKYAPHKPIHITLTNEDGVAKIVVRDEGPGIASEDRDRIFNRFERVASRENVGGLGLGLYISKQIVEAHHGKIYVSDSSNLGSVFTVELPEENFI